MNEIKIFKNTQFGNVRVVINESNEPLFCLSDVAKALGYSRPADAVTQHCKGVVVLPTPTVNQYGATVMQEMKYGKEGEVYRLTMKSQLPDAERFQDWVCDEVLPSIRKHGAYMTGETLAQMLQNPDNLIELLKALKSEHERNAVLSIQNEMNARTIEAMQPKAAYYDDVLQSDALISTDVVAARLEISAIKLNKFLCEYKIQRKVGGVYVLNSDLRGKGMVGYKEFVYTDPASGRKKSKSHMYWTQKGIEMIINLYISDRAKLLC